MFKKPEKEHTAKKHIFRRLKKECMAKHNPLTNT